MAEKITGWYPDPGGAADRYRYWDGITWSTTTTGDPREPPPTGPPGAPQHRSRLGMIIGLLATVVIMVIGGALLVGNIRSTSEDPSPTATVSGGDDSSPSEPAQSQDEASPSSPSPQPLSVCQRGNPDDRSPHPDDGRVYGGNLSFAEQGSFDPATSEPRLSFAWDVTQQIKIVSRTRDGFPARRRASSYRRLRPRCAYDSGKGRRVHCHRRSLPHPPRRPTGMFGVRRSRSTTETVG